MTVVDIWHLPGSSSLAFPANSLIVNFNSVSKTRLYIRKFFKPIFYIRWKGKLSFWAFFALFYSVFVKVKFYEDSICWTETEMASEYITVTALFCQQKARG